MYPALVTEGHYWKVWLFIECCIKTYQMQSWLEGISWVGKVNKQQGWPQAWEYSQAKLIQTLGRASQGVDWSWSQCIKSHHAQTSSGKGLPSHFWNRNNVRSILPGLRRKRTGLLLSGLKSSFQIKVNFAFHLEIKVWSRKTGEAQNPSCLKSSVKFPHSVMIWVPWHLLVLVHCVLSSPKSMQPSTRRFWSTLCFHLPTSFMEMLISFSSRTLAPAHSAKPLPSALLTMILLCLIGQPTCLTWTPYGIYVIFSRERWETLNPTIQTSWRLNSASAVPQADRLHDTPHRCWNLCYRSPDHVLSAWTYFKELELFCFANPFLGNILIFWDTGFLTFMSCKL